MVNVNGINFIKFIVTGRYYNSTKRFRKEYLGTDHGFYCANMINLWRGNLWGVTSANKRVLLKKVTN